MSSQAQLSDGIYLIDQLTDRGAADWSVGQKHKLAVFLMQQPWLGKVLTEGMTRIQEGTKEGQTIVTVGRVPWRLRIDKPWGWELIGPVVREAVAGGEEGYALKVLVIVGPLSRQRHDDYTDANGQLRTAKVETQLVLGPSNYIIHTDTGTEQIEQGGVFHIPGGTWHQPDVEPDGVVCILEVSKPNLGPGSTTRDPNGDPWAAQRSTADR